MKKWLLTSLVAASLSCSVQAADQDYKLVTVAGYLNFYLLNLNACEDFHPSVRKAAFDAEQSLYPWLEKLDARTKNSIDASVISDVVKKRRNALNVQINEGDFTLEHCQAVIKLLSGDGLDKTLLKNLD
jgi:opacity protein-like surface antigen